MILQVNSSLEWLLVQHYYYTVSGMTLAEAQTLMVKQCSLYKIYEPNLDKTEGGRSTLRGSLVVRT